MLQNLHRNNQRILVVVIVHHSVEDVHLTVRRASSKEGIRTCVGVESSLINNTLVALETAVRFLRVLCVEPLSVCGGVTHDEVLTFRMDTDAGSETTRGLEALDELVGEEVVAADGVRGGEEEVWFRGVELAIGDDLGELSEGAEDLSLGDVEHDCLAVLDVVLGAEQ